MKTIDSDAAAYLVDLTKALKEVKSGETSYGTFYVEEVKIAFDGETTSYRLWPDDFGGYEIGLVEEGDE